MLKFLSKIPANAPVGLYTMNSLGFHVLFELTTDHAALEAQPQGLHARRAVSQPGPGGGAPQSPVL